MDIVDILGEIWLPGKIDFLENETSREMRIFAFMGIIFNRYLDIRTSWIFGHDWYSDIMDIWTSWIFGHHRYSDIKDIWTSWIFGHHAYLDIMDIWTSWIFRHHGYTDIMDIQMSWISGCLDIVDILGDTTFSGKIVFPEKDTFEALSMQSCIANLYIWNIGAAGARRTFPHFYHSVYLADSLDILETYATMRCHLLSDELNKKLLSRLVL